MAFPSRVMGLFIRRERCPYPREGIEQTMAAFIDTREEGDNVSRRMRQVGYRQLLLPLVALAIAGLLSMHGLDPVVATLEDPSYTGHGSDGELVVDVHGVAGLCLFIAATAALALARRNMRLGKIEASSISSPIRFADFSVMGIGSGPPPSNRLRVLRR